MGRGLEPGFGLYPVNGSEQAVFGEAEVAVGGDDHVVEDVDPHRLAGLFQPGGDLDIVVARTHRTGRMVMGEDHPAGVELQSGGNHFPGMDGRPVDRPLGDLLDLDDLVGGIEKDRREDFPVQTPQILAEIVENRPKKADARDSGPFAR